ncbi:hypothetical protein Tco_0812471 [Tanacetum coccineum]
MADHSHKWHDDEGNCKENIKRRRTTQRYREIHAKESETFAKKVKRGIKEEQDKGERLLESLEKELVNTLLVNTIRQAPNYTKCLQEMVSEKIKNKVMSMVKLNARCSAVLQNEISPKEKDPGCFILPCIIGNTTVSNTQADLAASISVMPFSMFKRLGLGTPKPIIMVIEMADRSMQSPKGIDNKVPIILRRPMLATAHDRIDVFRLKISLEVGTEKFVFNANEGKTPLSVCVINDFEVPGEFEEPRGLEEFLMNDDINEDLGDFLEENDLLPKIDSDTLEVLPDSDDEIGIRLEDSGEGIEIFWDAQDLVIAHEINPSLRPQFLGVRNRIHHQNPYNLRSLAK